MPKENFSKKFGISAKSAVANIILISNAFVWYSFAFSILKSIIDEPELVIWCIHFIGATFSALVGAKLADKIRKKTTFISLWMLFGMLSSLTLVNASLINSYAWVIFLIFGISFGLGLPTSLGYFAECTIIENRAKIGGLILLFNGIGAFLLGITPITEITLQALTLAIWRGLGLIFFLTIKPTQTVPKRVTSVSFTYILSQHSFLFYLIPWIMFSLVNYLSAPVFSIRDANLFRVLVTIENALMGVFAVLGGFFSDIVGRKRITITGFILLGLGYAALGIYPENLFSWYFYALVDSIAWGIFSVIFIFTIWGDLSYGASSDKYYAVGGLPFFLSNFLRLTIGSYIAETISAYAIFSFAAFFLFLAVVPLMFAPETLPEKSLRERELRQYIEKAKKIKEKYV
ncbi:MAG: hypothetical protein QXL57_09120 [Candidatus Bathyarchaeia archaeon]